MLSSAKRTRSRTEFRIEPARSLKAVRLDQSRLPDHPKLVRELRLLERRTHRSGKDAVDHGKTGSDDFANSVCGVLRTLSAYSGGFDLEVYRRANGELPDTPHQLDEKYAGYAARPTFGPDQPGAEDLGSGGYRVPSFQEQLDRALGRVK